MTSLTRGACLFIVPLFTFSSFLSSSVASGLPAIDTCVSVAKFGDHYYQVFTVPSAQSLARVAASQMTYNGLQGHLVTITSQPEQEFVAALTKNYGSRFWIDGERIVSGGFSFASGPDVGASVAYTNWESGQPNNNGGDQDCIEFTETGLWADWACGEDRGFIVEYEACAEPWCTRMLSS